MTERMAAPTGDTVLDRLGAVAGTLTRAERQLAAAIHENYPVSGLVSITRLAEAAQVSTPTVARMVQKLGFTGFPAFQDALRAELEARISTPLAKRARWAAGAPDDHLLNRFTDVATANIRRTLAQIDPAAFDAAVALLTDPARALFVTGGRITGALADTLYLHMQVCRGGVRRVLPGSGAWAHDLLDLRAGDTLVVYDIRRYENATLRIAETAAERDAEIVLLTDTWRSPVERHARHVFSCRIEAPSAWDSSVALLLLTEILIAAAQERLWDGTAARMRELETLFDRGRTFRKFT